MKKHDVLWKGVIEDFFSSFLDFFHPKYVHLIDKEKGFEFLDKELQKITPKSSDSKRFVDSLVKVYLKKGPPIWILIHIEVQGYPDQKFDERMYIYQYRIFDKYKMPTAALAIFTDDDSNFHPQKYRQRIFDTIIDYKFKTYKLSEQTENAFEPINNPFSIIMEMAWWGLKKNKLTQRQLFSKKINLYRKLKSQDFSNQQIHNLLSFIKYYIPFEKPELNLKFEKEVNKLDKNVETMGIQETLLNLYEEKGIEKGIEKGREEGREEGREKGREEGQEEERERISKIFTLLKEGHSVTSISKKLKLSLEYVQKIEELFNLK